MLADRTRFIEIDLARVAAITLMMAYHLVYDLETFYGWQMNIDGAGWFLTGKTSATIFLLLTGLCFTISWQSTSEYKKILRRGVRILSYAAVVSIVTYLFDEETYVRFGILHLIALSSVLLPLFVPLGRLNAILGLLAIIASQSIVDTISDTSLLLPLGWTPPSFRSVDYFPLFPWFGVVLIGMVCGTEYEIRRARINLDRDTKCKALSLIQAISRKSLLIYMVHQPLLLFILWLLLGNRG